MGIVQGAKLRKRKLCHTNEMRAIFILINMFIEAKNYIVLCDKNNLII